MKKFFLATAVLCIMAGSFTSCQDTNRTEKLEERMEENSDKLDNRSDDFEDASDHIGVAAMNIEEAMENFRDALEEIDNPEDRKIIRQRINAILDSLEVRKRE